MSNEQHKNWDTPTLTDSSNYQPNMSNMAWRREQPLNHNAPIDWKFVDMKIKELEGRINEQKRKRY